MKAFLLTLILACSIASAQSQEGRPVAGKTYTLLYKPAIAGVLQDADQIWVVYAFDYWGTTAHQVQKGESGDSDLFDNVIYPDSGRATRGLMTKEGGVWRAEVSVPNDAALLSYYFTDGTRYDFNDRKTYVSYVYDENGNPVRNARLRNVDFLLMAGKGHQDVIDELHQEIAEYPDNFLAHLVYWRFQILDTISPDTLSMLMSKAGSYYDELRSQYGDTVLTYKALSLYDIDRVIQLSLSDSISMKEPAVAELTRSVNSAILKTIDKIPAEKRSPRMAQIESFARYMLLSPEEREKMQQEGMKRMQEQMMEFVGQPAPDFSFETVTGEKHRLSDFRGSYVLLDFWGSWCGPCVQEIPNLAKAYAKFVDSGLVIISISSDAFVKKWSPEKLADYAESKGMGWMQVLDDTASTIHKLYKIQFWPNPFLIDKDGKVLQRDGLRGADLDKSLSKLFDK